MNLTKTNQIDCLLNCNHTLAACQSRQTRHRRYSNPRDKSSLNPMFISCKNCKYWLTDQEYQTKTPEFTMHEFGVRGKIARKHRREENLTTPRSEETGSGHEINL